MKKILILLVIAFSFWLNFVWNVYAEPPEGDESSGDGIIVEVTEYIPWAGCECKGGETDGECSSWIYECTVKPWFETFMDLMGTLIRYFAYLASLWWVLFIVYNGIMYSMGGIDDNLKTNAKKRIIQTLLWLLVLFLSWVILYLVAPWVYVK